MCEDEPGSKQFLEGYQSRHNSFSRRRNDRLHALTCLPSEDGSSTEGRDLGRRAFLKARTDIQVSTSLGPP
jgi:hypothetical protein